MLVTERGDPIPNSETVARLKQIDGDLDLRWHPAFGRWAIMYKWRRSDPRWQLVQQGRVPEAEALDAIAWLPADCSADEAYGYVVRSFKSWAGTRDDVRKLLDRVHSYNKRVGEEAVRPTLELADELLTTNARSLFRDQGKTTGRTAPPPSTGDRDQRLYEEFKREGP